MSITTINKKFNKDFNNFFICDFVIDTDDAKKVFQSYDNKLKFTFSNPNLKINIIKFDEDVHQRVSTFIISDDSFVLNDDTFNNKEEWELIEDLEIENCQVLILTEELINGELDEWLESCIKMEQLYKVEEDGRICLLSGFGPGYYNLYGIKKDDKYVACKMEFIKEKI